MSVEPEARLFTVDELQRMDEAGVFGPDERVELLGGVIYPMPVPGPPHAGAVDLLTEWLVSGLAGRAIARIQNPTVLDDYWQPMPDLMILRRHDDFYRRAHPRPEDIYLVIEVMDSSVRRDRRIKLLRYAETGIPEVWLFDVPHRRLEVHREPAGSSYREVSVLGPGQTVAPVAFGDLVLELSGIL